MFNLTLFATVTRHIFPVYRRAVVDGLKGSKIASAGFVKARVVP